MTLAALEQDFDRYVREHAGSMEARVVGTKDASAAQRLGVYADAYRLRLCEVLGNDYSALRRLTGDERFRALGNAYIDAHPSRHFNARWFGAQLPAFLASTQPWRDEPALAEMAQLEWALTMVFDAPDQPAAGIEAAAAIAPEQWGDMRVELVAAQRLLTLAWNVGEVREAQADALPALARLAQPEARLVWRRELETYTRELAPDEAAALEAARTGETFAVICERVGTDEDAALRAAGLLRRWLEEGLVHALRA